MLAAKLFLTADVLSGGRVIAGVGAGWMQEEFAALGTPPFEERGAVTDEFLAAWKTLWTEAQPALDGKYVKFDNVMFMPKPVAQPHPPIWVGGESPAALRRTVRFGDALVSRLQQPVSASQHADPPARSESAACIAPRNMPVAIRRRSISPISGSARHRPLRRPMPTGRASCSPAAGLTCWRTSRRSRSAGARHVILYLQRPTIEETLEVMQRFAEEVIAKA